MDYIDEKINIVLSIRNMSKAELARRLGWSTSNFYNKLARNDFRMSDLEKIAKELNCTFETSFRLNDMDISY